MDGMGGGCGEARDSTRPDLSAAAQLADMTCHILLRLKISTNIPNITNITNIPNFGNIPSI